MAEAAFSDPLPIRAKALRSLAEPLLLGNSGDLSSLRPKLRLWHYPKTDAFRSWTLFMAAKWTTGPTGAIVREVTWHRSVDRLGRKRSPLAALKLRSPRDPSLSFVDAHLPMEPLVGHLDRAATIDLPMGSHRRPDPCDAECPHGLEGYGKPRYRIQWEEPTAHIPFTVSEWAMRLRIFFIRCIAEQPE